MSSRPGKMNEKENTEPTEEEFLTAIAGAVVQTDGVAAISGTASESIPMMGSILSGIHLSESRKKPVCDIYVDVNYGARIPEIAWNIQTAVCDRVRKEFGIEMKAVNIHVQSVVMPAQEKNHDEN